jgi:hypothetical protein
MSSNVEQEHLPIILLFMTEVGENNLKSIAIGTTIINITYDANENCFHIHIDLIPVM